MKKVLSILVLALVAVQLAFAGDVITRDAKQLPLTARNFINRYFTDPQISHIKIETGILGSKSYEVLLTDRTEIDFDSNGNWTDVDCKKAAVPEALIPVSVKEYVKTNFPQEVITKIERRRSGVEVELANDYYFVADCWMDGREMDVWYDVQATWKLTETDILWEGLPPTVQTAFEGGEYAQWKREDIDMLEYPVQPVQYVIEVERGNEEYQLFYAGDGNLLQKRDVSGNKDDTHWPIDELKTGR